MEHDAIINCLIAAMLVVGGLGRLSSSPENSKNYLVLIVVAFALMGRGSFYLLLGWESKTPGASAQVWAWEEAPGGSPT